MTTKKFADDMVRLGRGLGRVEGLKLAIDIMRAHGLDVVHPARMAVFEALMDDAPPCAAAPATPDAA